MELSTENVSSDFEEDKFEGSVYSDYKPDSSVHFNRDKPLKIDDLALFKPILQHVLQELELL